MYLSDIKSVADHLPQGTLVPVVQKGKTSDFLLEALERVCVLAQKEVRDLNQQQCRMFAKALDEELCQLNTMKFCQEKLSGLENFEAYKNVAPIQVLIEKKREVEKMQAHFAKLAKGARCTDGYHCASPCGFGDGIGLTSLV